MSEHDLATVIRSTAPTVIWAPILAGSAAILLIAGCTRAVEPDHGATGARLGTLLLVTGLVLATEDPAANTTAASPVPFRIRCVTRAALPILSGTAVWLIAFIVAPLTSEDRQLLVAEVLALSSIAAAATLAAPRLGSVRPGLLVGPLLLGLVLLSSRLGDYAFLPIDVATADDSTSVERAYVCLALILALAGPAIRAASGDPIHDVGRRRARSRAKVGGK